MPVMELIMSGLLLLIPSYKREKTRRLVVVSVVKTNTKKQITKEKTNTNTNTNNLDHEWCAPLIPLSEQTKRVAVVSVV